MRIELIDKWAHEGDYRTDNYLDHRVQPKDVEDICSFALQQVHLRNMNDTVTNKELTSMKGRIAQNVQLTVIGSFLLNSTTKNLVSKDYIALLQFNNTIVGGGDCNGKIPQLSKQKVGGTKNAVFLINSSLPRFD